MLFLDAVAKWGDKAQWEEVEPHCVQTTMQKNKNKNTTSSLPYLTVEGRPSPRLPGSPWSWQAAGVKGTSLPASRGEHWLRRGQGQGCCEARPVQLLALGPQWVWGGGGEGSFIALVT